MSLVPAVTQMLFAIGAGPQVVAVSSYDQDPPEVRTLPRVGALLDPDLERILSLRPDLVVVYGSQHDLRAQLSRAQVPAYVYAHATSGALAHVTSTIRELGMRTGHQDEAERVASAIERDLARVRERTAGRRRPRTLVVFGREPGTLRNLYASGGLGFIHELLEAAGGENVFGSVRRESVQASSEMLLRAAPEVILELRGDGATPVDLDAWQTVSAIPAVRARRIVVLTGNDMVVPGPAIAIAAQRMADALHGP
ncbi:MAG TPA: ABC transporter substrate-binding protein [Vicinamibacterales bacterium]